MQFSRNQSIIMDSFRKHVTLVIIALTLIQGVSAFCQEKMVNDKGYKACVKRYHDFIEKHEALNGTHDAEAVFKTLCSPEGRTEFYCMLRYYINCPELLNSDGPAGNPFEKIKIPGVEVSSFLYLDSMDNICGMNTGTCSEVKKCFTGLEQYVRYTPKPDNYFLAFQNETKRICGEIKDGLMCVLNITESCPRSLDEKIEGKFQNLMHRRMANIYNAISYNQAKHFILNECDKTAPDFAVDMCTKSIFLSDNFTTCNEDIAMKYSQKRSCNVHVLIKQCLIDNIKPHCAEETTMFLIRNSHMIFPGIPDNCENGGNNICQTSSEIIIMSLFCFYLFFKA
ncbi:uncharacterized protein LOC123555329 [Mercenaria mercenaria]|uniref:uncharacterized protein LOC123555329 n=1 Tax=Mercenaria mercenaria TaxID=6596 RepID=UPI00234F563B|nr:uncharacterized protein LOC123555329 [Mercenaria mercenaria]